MTDQTIPRGIAMGAGFMGYINSQHCQDPAHNLLVKLVGLYDCATPKDHVICNKLYHLGYSKFLIGRFTNDYGIIRAEVIQRIDVGLKTAEILYPEDSTKQLGFMRLEMENIKSEQDRGVNLGEAYKISPKVLGLDRAGLLTFPQTSDHKAAIRAANIRAGQKEN
jgi:hypothetical protein